MRARGVAASVRRRRRADARVGNALHVLHGSVSPVGCDARGVRGVRRGWRHELMHGAREEPCAVGRVRVTRFIAIPANASRRSGGTRWRSMGRGWKEAQRWRGLGAVRRRARRAMPCAKRCTRRRKRRPRVQRRVHHCVRGRRRSIRGRWCRSRPACSRWRCGWAVRSPIGRASRGSSSRKARGRSRGRRSADRCSRRARWLACCGRGWCARARRRPIRRAIRVNARARRRMWHCSSSYW